MQHNIYEIVHWYGFGLIFSSIFTSFLPALVSGFLVGRPQLDESQTLSENKAQKTF